MVFEMDKSGLSSTFGAVMDAVGAGARRVACLIAIGAFAASLLALAGCSSQSGDGSAGFDVVDIEVSKSGYSLGDDGTLRYVFIANNPNEGHLAENVVFSVGAYDASDELIADAGITVPAIYPNHREAVSGSTQVYATSGDGSSAAAGSSESSLPEVAYIRISPIMESAEWSDTSYDGAALEGLVSIDETKMSNRGGESLSISAQVSTTLDSVDLFAVAVLSDADGNLICGSDWAVFECASDGGPSSISLSIANAPEYENCYVYVSPRSAL